MASDNLDPAADPEKEARVAAMKAKIEALKKAQAEGGAPAPKPAGAASSPSAEKPAAARPAAAAATRDDDE